MKSIFLKYYAFVPVLALCCFYLLRAMAFPVHDFANYYFGGQFLAQGNFGEWIYFPYEFNQAIADTGNSGIFVSYAPNTPFLALIFAPLSFWSAAFAKLIFNCISIGLFLYALQKLASHYKIDSVFLLLLPILFLVPIKNELLFGQVYFLLFFLLAETWLAYEKEKFAKTGIFLAFAILLKVFPVLLILAFVFQKKWKALFYTLISCGVLFLISMGFSGSDIWIFYFQEVLSKAGNGEISEAYVVNYQSILMFLKQLLVFDKTQNPEAFFNCPVLFSALIFALKIKLITIGYYVSRNANNSLFVISYWILAMILLSPYGSSYTFLLLVFAYFSLVKSPLSKGKKIIGFMLLFTISNVPLATFTSAAFPISYLRLLALLLFFVLFLSWLWYLIDLKIVSIIVMIPLLLVLFFKKMEPKTEDYVLGKDSPILIYDYFIDNNQLTYFYWNENGKNARTIPFAIKKAAFAVIKNDRLYYNGKELLHDNNHKLKPIATDDKTVIYLSDADRGIGFYTLRKIGLP